MNWFLIAFTSAVFSASSTILEKKALFSLNAFNFSFLVSIVTLLFSIPFFWLVQYDNVFSFSLLILFFKTILSATAFLCVMQAIKNLEISEALPLLAISPGLVAIAGSFLINDSLTGQEWLGVFLMVAGTYILEIQKQSDSLLEPFRVLFRSSKYIYVFTALILFMVSSLLDRVLLKDYMLPPYTFMAFQQLFYVIIYAAAALIISIIYKMRGRSEANLLTRFTLRDITKKIFILIVFISVFTVIYRYTQIEATRIAPVALVLSVKRLSVLMAVAFGGKLFSEGNLLRKITAAVIILIGTTILMLD
ncbi:MAG: DMT family transporter [Ignavibacteriaceae bacterium]